MPSIKPSAVLGANDVANLLAGSQYEYLPWPAKVDIAVLTSPAGQVEATIYSGSDVLMEGSLIDEKATTDPITIFDFQVDDVADAGERLSITVRETAGVGATVRALVRLTPLV